MIKEYSFQNVLTDAYVIISNNKYNTRKTSTMQNVKHVSDSVFATDVPRATPGDGAHQT